MLDPGPGQAVAECEPGERAVGGGYNKGGDILDFNVTNNHPEPVSAGATPTGWRVNVFDEGNFGQFTYSAVVVCAAP